MSDSGPRNEQDAPLDGSAVPWWRSRRALVVATVLVVALVAVIAALLRPSGGTAPDAGPTPSLSPSITPSPSASPDAVPPAPTSSPTPEPTAEPTTEPPADPGSPPPYEPTTEPPVGLEEPGVFGTGVVARLVSIEAVDGVAQGPGEASGPSLQLVIELTNDTTEPVSLNTTVVELYAGPDEIPSNLLSGSGADLFSGELAAGDSTTGIYVFRVDPELRDRIQVTVSYTPAAPTLLFEGAAPVG